MAFGFLTDDYTTDDYLVLDCCLEFFIPGIAAVGFSRPPVVSFAPTLLQTIAATTGNVRYGYPPIVSLNTITMQWTGLPETEAAALEHFFRAHAVGILNTFIWRDYARNEDVAASFASPTLTITEDRPGSRSVACDLLVAL